MTHGIKSQCMVQPQRGFNDQYYTNVALKVNIKVSAVGVHGLLRKGGRAGFALKEGELSNSRHGGSVHGPATRGVQRPVSHQRRSNQRGV